MARRHRYPLDPRTVLTVRVPVEVHAWVREAADAANETVNDWLLRVIRAALATTSLPAPESGA